MTAPVRIPCWIGGAEVGATAGAELTTVSPVDGRVLASQSDSGEADVAGAVDTALRAYGKQRRETTATRSAWLAGAAAEIERIAPDLVEILIAHIGKPKRAASFEVARSAQFLRLCAAEVLGLRGEVLPLDAVPAGAGHVGFVRRIPYGVVAGITPFNAPVNLLVQKIAPALAAGNSIVIKPSPAAALAALKVAGAFQRAGLPDGLLNVVTGERTAALALVRHPRVAAVTFTGSTAAGHALAQAAGAKKFLAELGSNAANVVLADADLADAAKRIAAAGFEASGQQCISAQRVIVEERVFDKFLAEFVGAAKALRVGDPYDERTDVGPMVSAQAADRVMGMIDDAVAQGARLALAPRRDGCIVSPAIVVEPREGARLLNEEAFGPVVAVLRARDSAHALEIANASQFGLQGAVFTASLATAFRFAEEFEVGSLWINEASRFRLDMYPFGGVKQSGVGREGLRYAIEELSQLKFTGIRFE